MGEELDQRREDGLDYLSSLYWTYFLYDEMILEEAIESEWQSYGWFLLHYGSDDLCP